MTHSATERFKDQARELSDREAFDCLPVEDQNKLRGEFAESFDAADVEEHAFAIMEDSLRMPELRSKIDGKWNDFLSRKLPDSIYAEKIESAYLDAMEAA